jgi:tight adherence protein C
MRSRELGMHLEMMGAEMRAGRSTVEALDALSDRLRLDEAASFVAMLRQSIELGSDVGEALRVFSDEMRDKRLLRAEEKANKLSVKMVIPLGLFIFPVVLLVTILPVMIKLMKVIGSG